MKRLISSLLLLLLTVQTLQLWAVASAQEAAKSIQASQPSATQLNNQDVLRMVKAGFTPETIIAQIKSSPCNFATTHAALRQLKEEGVADNVILAMVMAPPEGAATTRSQSQTSTELEREMTVAEISAHVGGRVVGNGSVLIKGVASVESAGEGEIAFVEDSRLLESAGDSHASCLIVPEGAQVEASCRMEVKHPKLAFALIAELLHPPKRREPSIHPWASVAASASVDESAFIGALVEIGERTSVGAGTQVHSGAVIGEDVSIGRDCVIHPRVVIYDNVTLGDRVILHAGAVIGADGFGYVPDEKNIRHKFPQIGTVFVEDDVEIGACTCIDRGALGRTRIGRATKIDNLVQIAHNVEIGERVVIAAQTGISGSTVIEDDAVIGGQVGMGDHARVERGAIIGSKAGILPGKIVRAGVWWGIPVQPLDQYKRLNAHMNRLPQMREELKELRRQLKELQEKIKDKE